MSCRQFIEAAGADKVELWLKAPGRVYKLWFGRHCVVAAWLGLALGLISPPHGSGLSLCWLQNATGVPCPGCGLTRSLSCALRGMFLESWQYHPMGMLILALFILTATQSMLPKVYRGHLGGFMEARAIYFKTAYVGFVLSFVIFGAVRAISYWASVWVN